MKDKGSLLFGLGGIISIVTISYQRYISAEYNEKTEKAGILLGMSISSIGLLMLIAGALKK